MYSLLDLESNNITESRDMEFFIYNFFNKILKMWKCLYLVSLSYNSYVEVGVPSVREQPSEPKRSTRSRKENDLILIFLLEAVGGGSSDGWDGSAGSEREQLML